jgi:hypothetical protein
MWSQSATLAQGKHADASHMMVGIIYRETLHDDWVRLTVAEEKDKADTAAVLTAGRPA